MIGTDNTLSLSDAPAVPVVVLRGVVVVVVGLRVVVLVVVDTDVVVVVVEAEVGAVVVMFVLDVEGESSSVF